MDYINSFVIVQKHACCSAKSPDLKYLGQPEKSSEFE
jgi:hypothetical protein